MISTALALLLASPAPPHELPGRIKTNAAFWAVGIPNAEPEFLLGRHFSATLPVAWAPWFISRNFAVRTLAIQPEGRYWLRQGFSGHFFGVHFSAAWFNARLNEYRYQDTGRPLLGGGISYGYTLPISSRCLLEFSIGAGFADLRYDRYHNTTDGMKIDTRHTTYFGIDRISISVAYSFDLPL